MYYELVVELGEIRMSTCQVKSIKNNDAVEFVFSGSIDESLANFISIFPEVPSMTINLDQVSSINSTGIREWIKLMDKIGSSEIKLIKCPKVFIDQVNMVKDFLPENALIESFYVPYFSETKNSELKILFERGRHFTKNFINCKETIADEAGTIYELDVISSKYFKFIKN